MPDTSNRPNRGHPVFSALPPPELLGRESPLGSGALPPCESASVTPSQPQGHLFGSTTSPWLPATQQQFEGLGLLLIGSGPDPHPRRSGPGSAEATSFAFSSSPSLAPPGLLPSHQLSCRHLGDRRGRGRAPLPHPVSRVRAAGTGSRRSSRPNQRPRRPRPRPPLSRTLTAWEPFYVCRSPLGWGCCSRPPRRAVTQAREARRAPSPTCTCPGSGRYAGPARMSREWQCPQSCVPRPEAGGQGRRSRSAARLPTTEQARGARRPRRASSLPAARARPPH